MLAWRLVVDRSLEEQNVRLRLMYLIMFPPQTLGDAEPSPLFLPEQLERASRPIKVLLWYLLQHLLWQLHMAVFEVVIIVPRRVVYRIDELIKLIPLDIVKQTRLLVAACVINVHGRHAVQPPLQAV